LFGGQFQAHGRGDRGSLPAWLVPTIEKFPKSYKFIIGDRIETIDVLKALIEATYTMERTQHLRQANLGIEKATLLFRRRRRLRIRPTPGSHHRAMEKLVELAKREGVELRQSCLRLAKRAAIMVGRYTHAHQFKRARRELKFLRTRLGRVIRDIRRKIKDNTALEDRFGPLLDLALRVRHQEQRQRGPKVYSLHAPEVECIGRRAPYEFGCKVSIATPVTAPKGGQFVLHAKALHGNP
jgi:hypothetical protein